MSADGSFESFRESEFVKWVEGILPQFFESVEITSDPKLKGGSRPDFILKLADGSQVIAEVKNITPTTKPRLHAAVEQLARYSALLEEDNPESRIRRVLIVPGPLSVENLRFLHDHGVDQVIDGQMLRSAGVPSVAFEGAVKDSAPSNLAATGRALTEALAFINPGKDEWSAYQKLIGRILEFLFCPPLGEPIPERANLTKTNRRDFILANYSPDNFWGYMRSTYEAHYIVVDAKNWVRKIKKEEILQLANYLSPLGAGLFGIIMSRHGEGNSAEITRREQWAYHKKMILILTDDDTKQMITLRASGGNPADLVRQQIEDFRLGF